VLFDRDDIAEYVNAHFAPDAQGRMTISVTLASGEPVGTLKAP
jgi:hypothetical protein